MKKKARRLLTVTLVVCMGLIMSAGTASADITIAGSGESIHDGYKLEPSTQITSDAPGGLKITYNVPADMAPDGSTDSFTPDPDAGSVTTDLIPDSFDIYHNGYIVTQWTVKSITTVASTAPPGNQDILELSPVMAPISYTLEYYDSDQTTLLYRDENITMENAAQYKTRTATRDGYVLSHWYRAVSDSTMPPDHPLDMFFVASEGRPESGYVIKFYAVWTPLDHSPAAGDDMPVGMLAFLVIASIASAAVVAARSKKDAM